MAYSIDTKAPDGELRILLVGKTGVGKSSTGNSLLGKQEFETSRSLTSVTKETQYGEAVRFGRRLTVIDTPGFYDTERSNREIVREIVRIFGFLSPGIHILMYIMGVERFTEECIKTKDLVLKTFGEGIKTRIIIVITHFDDLEAEHVDTKRYLASSGKECVQFQNMCSNRVFFINNKAKADILDQQVFSLLQISDDVIKKHGGECFTNYHLRLVRAYLRQEKKRKIINLSRARRMLFERASIHLGLQKVVVWHEKKNRPVPVTVSKGSAHFVLPSISKNVPKVDKQKLETSGKLQIKPDTVTQASVSSCNTFSDTFEKDVTSIDAGRSDDSHNLQDNTEQEADCMSYPADVSVKETRVATGYRCTEDSERYGHGSQNAFGPYNDTKTAMAEKKEINEPESDSLADLEEQIFRECLERGSEEASVDIEDTSDNRKKIQNKSVFGKFADFFVSLFNPLVD